MALAAWLAVEVSIPRIYSISATSANIVFGKSPNIVFGSRRETGSNRRYGVVTVTFRKVASMAVGASLPLAL